ncbi:ribonuclease T2-like [Apophysomyces sp. BC1034]|nr:ribonuclease T2-like [Apophysomyces sp. BC1015]KAG0178320.1 ribonuclease T2-like [Apophysomyces sp. BC1021]KAG0188631.1 ribonuclease T2-like [Apophysomyces sp. BC1034]
MGSNDSCCVENGNGGGMIMLSQFWDVKAGDPGAWTIHGLWTDYCNGQFPQFCDGSRAYSDISDILQSHGEYGLLDEMNHVWPNSQGSVDTLWSHEWDKHGTCMSTFEPDCYGGDSYQGMIAFFKSAVALYKRYDIYNALQNRGIVPGASYSADQFTTAIKTQLGFTPNLRCKGSGIHEMWIYFYVKGPVEALDVTAAEPDSVSNCHENIYYPLKN